MGFSKQIAEKPHEINRIKGVIPYIDPQALNNNNYELDKRSDVYSLGVLLWEITSGRLPFENSTDDVNTILLITSGKRGTPASDTPSEYQLLYTKCWDEVPDKRPLIEDVSTELNKLLTQKREEDKPTKSEKKIQEPKNMNFNPQLSSQKLRVEISSLSNDFNESISNELEEIKNSADQNYKARNEHRTNYK